MRTSNSYSMVCYACTHQFIFTFTPREEYPYCPVCGSGNTAWYDSHGKPHKNN